MTTFNMSNPPPEWASLWENFASLLRRWVHPPSPGISPQATSLGDATPQTTAGLESDVPAAFASDRPAAVDQVPLSPDSLRGFHEMVRDWDGKLTEVLARVDAIERIVCEREPAGRVSPLAGRDAEELTGLVQQLFEMQQRTLSEQISRRWSDDFAEQQTFLSDLRTELLAEHATGKGEPAAPHESGASAWKEAIFGPALPSDPRMVGQLDALCSRVLAGDAPASVLAGQLLIFGNALPERRPQLLKDVGEAFYRCFPKIDDADDVFEQALAKWLEQACEQAGFQNTIELVRPGQRFDSSRHTTDERGGIEITGVHGWVVMRSRDKVYTKAGVSAR